MAITTEAPRRTPSRTRGSAKTRDTTTATAAPDGGVVVVTAAADDLVPRFLNVLLPVAASLVAPALPAVGGAIGDLIGGSSGKKVGTQIGGGVGSVLGGLFGGREISVVDVEAARALEQYQLAQVVTQITQDCTPALVDAMRQEVESRSSRGESGDLDQEALERSWGFLASLVVDQVIKHAPAAIKAATKAVGSIVGSRDVDQLDPLLVDTETMQRFVLPSISNVLTCVQSCMPQLFSLLTAKREIPRDTGISWQDLESTKRLWDNDCISLLSLNPIDNPNEIEIVLELAPHKTWWKGIQVQDDNGSAVAEIGVQDRTKVASVRVPSVQLLDPGGYLVFMKAKMFGIHTGMYRLATGGLSQLAGHSAHFYWYAD
ncbi:hypothetical protein [Pseudonocardia sp.]|uniref:hypothetical protein n=1 Tax=Pseudonocardia sp. TaxID=60912 RepID=UPI003D1199EA